MTRYASVTDLAAHREHKDAERRERRRLTMQRYRAAHPGFEREQSIKFRRENPGYRSKAGLALLQEVNALKSKPCTDCGQTFPSVCMDFDHLPGSQKQWNVGSMVAHNYSRELVMAEIAKCELVCANCHRIRTHQRALLSKETNA